MSSGKPKPSDGAGAKKKSKKAKDTKPKPSEGPKVNVAPTSGTDTETKSTQTEHTKSQPSGGQDSKRMSSNVTEASSKSSSGVSSISQKLSEGLGTKPSKAKDTTPKPSEAQATTPKSSGAKKPKKPKQSGTQPQPSKAPATGGVRPMSTQANDITSEPTATSDRSTLAFIGPAGTMYVSFLAQIASYMKMYLPDWNDYKHPQSHIIPRFFYYQRSNLNDEDVEGTFKLDKDNVLFSRENVDRKTDLAEHWMYYAIKRLIDNGNGIYEPFIAIRSVNLNALRSYFEKLFPDCDTIGQIRLDGECDFVLIGPRIGIMIIEVKSSYFTQATDFQAKNKYLPDHLKKGLAQLKKTNDFINFLQAVTGVKIPDGFGVSRILFTPNLTRKRFFDWFGTLDKGAKKSTTDLVREADAALIFMEDAYDAQTLCDRLVMEIETVPSYITNHVEWKKETQSIYEAFAPVIVGLGTACVHKSWCELITLKLSSAEATLVEAERIDKNNPIRHSYVCKHGECKKDHVYLWDPVVEKPIDNTLLWTPDQKVALAGPNRQYLVGNAGTGKTLLIMEKAKQLLELGQSVLILCAVNYKQRYIDFFEAHRYTKYEVQAWVVQYQTTASLLCDQLQSNKKNGPFGDYFERVRKGIMDDSSLCSAAFGWVHMSDHIFIDDPFDGNFFMETSCVFRFAVLSTLMSYVHKRYPDDEKVVWVAIDGYVYMSNFDNAAGELYAVAFLRRIMRCAEEICTNAYPVDIHPIPGHKVQGSYATTSAHRHFRGAANDLLWLKVEQELRRMKGENFPMGNVAIIYHYEPPLDMPMLQTIRLRGIIERRCLRAEDRASYLEQEDEYLDAAETARLDSKNEPSPSRYGITVIVEEARARFQYYSLPHSMPSVHRWTDVSSLEWPVVIYAACVSESGLSGDEFAYSRYRAGTRARATLVEQIVSYTVDDELGPVRTLELIQGLGRTQVLQLREAASDPSGTSLDVVFGRWNDEFRSNVPIDEG